MANLTDWESLVNVTSIDKSDTLVLNDVSDVSPVHTKEITYSDFMMGMFDIVVADEATYTVDGTVTIINSTYATTGTQAITISTDALVSGKVLIIKDGSGGAGTNTITISTEGSEDIDGADTKTIEADYGVVRLFNDGTNWYSF